MFRKTLRLDRSLASLNRLIDAFTESRDRIRSHHGKVIAKWRLFPPEIIYALAATPYDLLLHEGLTRNLTGNLRGGSYAIEAGLSADSCPWNLTSAGMILSERDSTPVDVFLAGAGLCDVSSKSWQIMARQTGKPIYPVETPIFESNSQKRALSFIQGELSLLFARLGRRLGQQYSESRLREEVKKGNRVRRLLQSVTSLLSQSIPPLNALEYFLIHATAGDYLQDPDSLVALISDVKDETEKRINENKHPPGLVDDPVRIYYVGMAPQDLQFWNMIEDSGGALVGCDTYLPLFYELIPENDPVLEALAEWIWMMPHHMLGKDRANALIKYIKQQKPDAVIIGNVTGCRSLSSSDRIMKETLKEELRIPITSVEFGASEDDVALLEPHIKAFIEICR
jgi:benzoyl-CoA reductase/2-hydroxyglutaryl-CoA dehydratase subunit BcrC/BadD/HgdB